MLISFNFDHSIEQKNSVIKTRVLGKPFFVRPDAQFYLVKNNEDTIIIEGDLFYFYDGNKIEYLSNRSEEFINKFLSEIIKQKGWKYCRKYLEGHYTTVIFNSNCFQLQGDELKQKEIFYFQNKTGFLASSNLTELSSRMDKLDYNQNIIALVLSSHYQYSPARHTIYKDIYTLGPNESIEYSSSGFLKYKNLDFKNIETYNEDKLTECSEILDRAILGRSNNCINIANSTGGWDTTYIITVLVDLLGRDKVVSSIFSYMPRSGKSWNIYEKIKAKKVAKHFNIKYIELPIYLNSPLLADSLTELLPLLKSGNAYVNALHHFLLYKKIKEYLTGKKSGTVFSGEASDGLQNFGFTHWRGFFHESYPFKEYGDKMKNYLYSPVFYNKLKSNLFKDDMAFKIWKYISGISSEPSYSANKHKNFMFQYLAPVVLGQYRLPFENILTSRNLTEKGRNNLFNTLRDDYFADIITNINEKNYYSAVLHIYKLFHFQGPTVKMLRLTANFHGFKAVIPFLDTNVITFFEKMPMDWGRGLEFRNTKYPLKAIARRNKKFPIDIVESGIHAFLSEVDPKLKDEVYNFYFNSTATDYFREILSKHKYKDILSEEYFDLTFIKKEVNNFLNKKMEKIADFDSLKRLINFVSIGWY